MPTLSTSNRSQLAYKLEGVYPTNYGVPQAGNGTIVSMLSESLNFDITSVESKLIRSDRQVADSTQTKAMTSGGYSSEHVYRDHDPFIQAALQGDYTVYGTNGVSAAIPTLTATSTTLTAGTAPTGVDQFPTLARGQWFVLIPPAGASETVRRYFAGRPFRTTLAALPTATVITLDASTPLNTTLGGTNLNNFKIGTSRAVNGNTVKSYTLEVQHLDINKFRVFKGQILSKMDVNMTSGDIVTMNFEFMGSTGGFEATAMGTPAAAQTFTPANATRGIFEILENDQAISLTTYVKSMQFSVDNTLRGQDAMTVFGLVGIGSGTQRITGKMTTYLADEVLYNKFVNNTVSSLSIPVLDNSGNGYVYFFPQVKYQTAKVNTGGQDQDNMLEIDFQAFPYTGSVSTFVGQTMVIYRVGN